MRRPQSSQWGASGTFAAPTIFVVANRHYKWNGTADGSSTADEALYHGSCATSTAGRNLCPLAPSTAHLIRKFSLPFGTALFENGLPYDPTVNHITDGIAGGSGVPVRHLDASLPLAGGKGGFGLLLKSARLKKSAVKASAGLARDLSGRRVGLVSNEAKVQEEIRTRAQNKLLIDALGGRDRFKGKRMTNEECVAAYNIVVPEHLKPCFAPAAESKASAESNQVRSAILSACQRRLEEPAASPLSTKNTEVKATLTASRTVTQKDSGANNASYEKPEGDDKTQTKDSDHHRPDGTDEPEEDPQWLRDIPF